VDVCPNIPGDQSVVPDGLVKDDAGNCVTPPPPPVDECPDMPGNQPSKDECPPPPVDVCPNIDGPQSSVPAGMVKDAAGNCVTPANPAGSLPETGGSTTIPTATLALIAFVAGLGLFGASFLKRRRPATVKV
jgi:LPXTG-motif cell wall-anchored protein